MRLEKSLYFAFFAQLTLLVALFPTNANSATTGDTSLTIVISPNSGGLAISVPGTAAVTPLTSPPTTTNVTLELGTITVTDDRNTTGGSWTTVASATDLVSGVNSLAASSFGYSSGIFVKTGGEATMTENTRTALNTATAVVTTTGITGNHVITWTPSITVPVQAAQALGTYAGTITHSVS